MTQALLHFPGPSESTDPVRLGRQLADIFASCVT